jgi:Na+/H+-translocating membrane pyrophosphatase
MKTDDWKLHYTYWALFIFGIVALVFVFLKIDEIEPETLIALVTFVLGSILGFLTGAESATRAGRQVERASAQGAAQAGVTPANEALDPVTGRPIVPPPPPPAP